MWGLIVGSNLVDLSQYFEDLYVDGADQDLPVTPEWAKDYGERVAKYFNEEKYYGVWSLSSEAWCRDIRHPERWECFRTPSSLDAQASLAAARALYPHFKYEVREYPTE
jgi:hypothetical protein